MFYLAPQHQLAQRLHASPTKISTLCDRLNITELAIFGSALRHDFTSASDIDLLVTFHPEARITFF